LRDGTIGVDHFGQLRVVQGGAFFPERTKGVSVIYVFEEKLHEAW
jgi:hypothetical protein